jgi:murein DD-endopeptidase MepM/ murein hydrolase activator NlpD
MEGFLTLPFTDPEILTVLDEWCMYVDLDYMNTTPRDWMNESTHTFHNHLGTDFIMPIGTDLVAAAPGVVVEAMGTYPNVPSAPNWGYMDDGNRVSIDHGPISTFKTGNNASLLTNRDDFLTIYCHMNSVSVTVGQKVNRGDVIGESGHTGQLDGKYPHVHFQAGGFAHTRVDPFRDITGIADNITYWTKDNDPKTFNSDAKVYFP